MRFITSRIFAILMLSAVVSRAGVILWDNGTPPLNNGTASFSVSTAAVSDNFTLSATATIDTVRIWGGGTFFNSAAVLFYTSQSHFEARTPDYAEIVPLANISETPTPGDIFHDFQIDFALPSALTLMAGSYLLEIHDGSSITSPGTNGAGWTRSTSFHSPGLLAVQVSGCSPSPCAVEQGNDLSFQLFGTQAVPEPASSVIVSVGLAFLVLVGIRQRKSIHRSVLKRGVSSDHR